MSFFAKNCTVCSKKVFKLKAIFHKNAFDFPESKTSHEHILNWFLCTHFFFTLITFFLLSLCNVFILVVIIIRQKLISAFFFLLPVNFPHWTILMRLMLLCKKSSRNATYSWLTWWGACCLFKKKLYYLVFFDFGSFLVFGYAFLVRNVILPLKVKLISSSNLKFYMANPLHEWFNFFFHNIKKLFFLSLFKNLNQT